MCFYFEGGEANPLCDGRLPTIACSLSGPGGTLSPGATEDFAMSIHPHPTLSEGLSEAMENFLGKGVHS